MSLQDQKIAFIHDFNQYFFDFSQLCRRYGISRKTGYKWLNRYQNQGAPGLVERSHRPLHCPHKTPPATEARVIKARQDHPAWGARKIRSFIICKKPDAVLPSDSTMSDIIHRNGLIEPRRNRNPVGHPGTPHASVNTSNALWSVDFKGHDKTRNGIYCYPLTVMDSFSRYLLECKALTRPTGENVKPVFINLFKTYGLPLKIRSDNGNPFAASNSIARLSTLSVWWIRLGITPELIEPGCPQQNGRHERMHWTLKKQTMLPMAGSCSSQQKRFNEFINEYNHERPHEALGQIPPAQVYQPSPRQMPEKLPPVEYPSQFQVRFVSGNSCFRWNKQAVFLTKTLVGEYIGLEPIDDAIWDVYYCSVRIGRFFEKQLNVKDINYVLSKAKV